MRFEHTDRKGFWIGFIDFFTAGIFLLIIMPRGLQDEIDEVLGKKTQKYWKANLVGSEGKLMSYKHMFYRNVFWVLILVGLRYAEEMGAPELPGSGRQEYLESVMNNILFR